MIPVSTTQRGQIVAIAAAVIVWSILVTGQVLTGINQVTHGFAAYYGAAYAVLHGGASALTDDAVFQTWIPRSGIEGIQELFAGNVPTLALLMIPLTAFRPETAQTIWLFADVLMLVLCAWLAGRICAPHNATTRWLIAAAFPLLASVNETIQYGQVYLLLAFLSLIAFATLLKRRDIPAGIAVATMLLVKLYYGTLSFGVLVWSRRPRSIVTAIVAVAVILIGSLPLLANAWPGFLPAEINVTSVPWAGIPANQTLNSLAQHLFQYTPTWNPEPLIDAPWLAAGLYYALALLLLTVTLWRARRYEPLWLWPPALTLMPILAPVGEIHHYTLLLLPIAVGVTHLVEGKSDKPTWIVIGVGLLLLIIPWPSLHSQIGWGGWNGLLAYPRLMGGVLLWAGLTFSANHVIDTDQHRTPQN